MMKLVDFSALSLNPDRKARIPLVYPGTYEPIRDKAGAEAFIEVLSFDSAIARRIDKEQRLELNRMVMNGQRRQLEEEDPQDQTIEKLAAVTVGWYLVDPRTKEPMDVPFSAEAARLLYGGPGTAWIYRLALAGATDLGNFTQPPS